MSYSLELAETTPTISIPLLAEEKINRNDLPINILISKTPLNNAPGIRLTWYNIKLTINKSSSALSKKQSSSVTILDNISGDAKPGELYGIIGASGGGKTTLLSMLTGRLKSVSSLASKNTKCEGTITLNNMDINCKIDTDFNYLKKNIAFVMQNDLMYATEKCREAIEISALLRLPSDMTSDEKLLQAHKIMRDLDLINCAETYIGSIAVHGLSGGEKKRVSIGTELVTNPNIIILDEPTSGLDSANAYSIMLLLQKLAKQGKTVIACIHQPSSEIFNVIDKILILAKGKVVYEGYIKDDLYKYLASINFECPQYSNIADFIIQQINIHTEYFVTKWEEYQLSANTTSNETTAVHLTIGSNLSPGLRKIRSNSCLELADIQPRKTVSLTTQIPVLFRRQYHIFIRDKSSTVIRVAQILFVSLLVSIIWWQLKPLEDESEGDTDALELNLHNRFGALFLINTFCAMNTIGTSIIVFPAQRLIFEKERSGCWYNSLPWLIAKLCIDVPWTFIVLIPFAAIIKYTINLEAPLLQFYLVLVLVGLSADSIGFLVGCIFDSQKTATQLMPVILMPLMLFSNFFVSIDSVVVWLRWIHWVDCFYYGVELLCILEFEGVENHGSDVGDDFLILYGMNADNLWRDILALLFMFVAFRAISFMVIFKKNGF